MKYIPAEKLIAEIERRIESWTIRGKHSPIGQGRDTCDSRVTELSDLLSFITTLQQEQPDNMIQWTGNNLKEVIDFTGKSPRFGEWFKSWEELESYVHSHGDILKLFSEDGSHYEVPVGAWIVKTPDGYNVPSVAKYIQQEQPAKRGYKDCNGCEYNRPLKDQIGWQFRGCFGGDYKGKPIAEIELCPLKVAQPKVDLEKELDRYLRGEFQQTAGGNFNNYIQVARHFYELGLNARKEKTK